MYQKTLSIFLVLVAFFFLGSGITGFATMDSANRCYADNDCVYSVCCSLYGEDYGVCGQSNECEAVYQESKGGLQYAPEDTAAEKAQQNYIAIILGIMLVIIVAIVSYVEWHQEKVNPKKYARTHKKKRKARK